MSKGFQLFPQKDVENSLYFHNRECKVLKTSPFFVFHSHFSITRNLKLTFLSALHLTKIDLWAAKRYFFRFILKLPITAFVQIDDTKFYAILLKSCIFTFSKKNEGKSGVILTALDVRLTFSPARTIFPSATNTSKKSRFCIYFLFPICYNF